MQLMWLTMPGRAMTTTAMAMVMSIPMDTTVKLETGKVNIKGLGKDEALEGIIAYDKAERNGAYIGQINMITVSSFSGPNSAILWGYDIAEISDLYSKKLYDIENIPVYSMDPLLQATQTLFGTEEDRLFPPLAGAHVPCATKCANSKDPSTGAPTSGWVWCFFSLGIAENRERDACVFVEDAGFFPDEFTYGKVKALDEQEVIKQLNKKIQVTISQLLCGKNQSITFKEIFVSYRYLKVNQDQ